MDRRGASLAQRSKRVLAQGRRIATHLGATLYAVAAENGDDNDTWIAEAGISGADKVVLLSFGSRDSRVATELGIGDPGLVAAALMAVCDALSPNLVLMDNDPMSAAVAPSVASHFAGQVMLDVQPRFLAGGDIILEERTSERRRWRHVSLTKSTAPVIATISTAGVELTRGRDDADVIFFKAPLSPVTLSVPTPTSLESDPALDGRVVVCAGSKTSPVLPEIRRLATLLNAPLVSTSARKGQASDLIDLSQIAPVLCICCGDTTDLQAFALGTEIVSLGIDPRSTSIVAARYAVLGPLSETLPALLQAISAHVDKSPNDASKVPVALPIAAPALADAFTPSPDAVELFSDPSALLVRLQADRLWIP